MNKRKNTGGLAFPIVGSHEEVLETGMTLRDYFAAKAMQAYFSDGGATFVESNIGYASIVAYKVADAMLDARSGK